MKKLLFASQFPLFIAFNFFVLTTVLELAINNSAPGKFNRSAPQYNGKEEFDPSLGRLNSLKKLEGYCDSIYSLDYATKKSTHFEEVYPEIVVSAVKKRFYHGYSYFGLGNNFAAKMLEPLTGKNASAIVLPDEILKYPYGACSQQSIVVMDLLKKKGLLTREVGFQGKLSGHFSFETFYNGSWHFFDPNMEPDLAILDKYNRPGIAFLTANSQILISAYRNLPNEFVVDVFSHYHYGKPQAALAPWATLYQQVTRFLSYTLWIFFLMAFIWVRRKYRRLSSSKYYVRNSRVYLPQFQPGTSPTYHFGS